MSQLVGLAEDNIELNFDAVFLACLKDMDAQVRQQAIRGLWEYEGSDLIAPLLRLLGEDEDGAVRAQAALALGRFVLLWEEGRLRSRYFEAVEGALRRILADDKEPEEVRARALEAIGACSSRGWVRQAIQEFYERGVQRLRVSSIHAMGRSGDPRWLPLLFRELCNEDAEARYEAALACGAIGEEEAVSHLWPLLQDGDPEVRSAAIAALGQIGGGEAKSLLISLAADASPSVREALEEALREIDFSEDPLALRLRF
jgi:HEAT repeat protein